jgi:transposase-like protein
MLSPNLLSVDDAVGYVAIEDREKFGADLDAVLTARNEAQGRRAFWELAVRWEWVYPALLHRLELDLDVL